MKYSTRITPISYLKSSTADFGKELSETLAMLKLLALGNRAAESSQFRDAEAVFAELDKEDAE